MCYDKCNYRNTCKLIREFCEQIENCEMKHDLLELIKAKSGKSSDGEIEHVTYKGGEKHYTRKHGKRVTLEHNIKFGRNSSAINNLWMSMPKDFKDDCRRYAQMAFKKNVNNKAFLSSINIFYRALSKHKPQIQNKQELKEIYGNTLDEWIKKGYLDAVKTKEPFSAQIIPDL